MVRKKSLQHHDIYDSIENDKSFWRQCDTTVTFFFFLHLRARILKNLILYTCTLLTMKVRSLGGICTETRVYRRYLQRH